MNSGRLLHYRLICGRTRRVFHQQFSSLSCCVQIINSVNANISLRLEQQLLVLRFLTTLLFICLPAEISFIEASKLFSVFSISRPVSSAQEMTTS